MIICSGAMLRMKSFPLGSTQQCPQATSIAYTCISMFLLACDALIPILTLYPDTTSVCSAAAEEMEGWIEFWRLSSSAHTHGLALPSRQSPQIPMAHAESCSAQTVGGISFSWEKSPLQCPPLPQPLGAEREVCFIVCHPKHLKKLHKSIKVMNLLSRGKQTETGRR